MATTKKIQSTDSERPSFDHAKYSIDYRDADYAWQKAEFEGSFSDMVKYAKSLADYRREWCWETVETMTEEIAGLTFEVIGLDTAIEGYNWGSYDLAEDKPIYRRCYVDNSEQYEVFIANDCGIYSDGGDWYCEISESGSCYAQAWGETPAEAMLNAYAQTTLADALDEGNCEDAVNVCAYNAFEAMLQHPCHWETAGDYEVMDSLLGIARRLVKRSCEEGESGFEWEEF